MKLVAKQKTDARSIAEKTMDLVDVQELLTAMCEEILEGGAEHGHIARLREILDFETEAHYQAGPDPDDYDKEHA